MSTIKIISMMFIYTFAVSCLGQDKAPDNNTLLEQYVSVWNGESLDKLDNIIDKNFQLRSVPDLEPKTGIDKLKEEITVTRAHFPDFHLVETEKLEVSDTAVVLRWTLTGTFTNEKSPASGNKLNIPGFSVIFFGNGKLTGEWICYSESTWYKQLGYSMVYKGKD